MKKLLGFYLVLATLLIPLDGKIALAENLNSVRPGMEYADVVKLKGTPKEKREREVRRISVWVYKDSEITFQEGKVVAVGEAPAELSNVKVKNNAPVSNAIQSRRSQNAAMPQKLVDEIIDAIPNEGDSPAASGPSQPNVKDPAMLVESE